MPMYFPKTALSASSDHLTGLRFKFLGTLIAIPVIAKAEISQQGWSSVKVEDQVLLLRSLLSVQSASRSRRWRSISRPVESPR